MLEKANKDLLNLAYDSLFEEIQELRWFPWVGKDYDNPEHRLLIIGESHYCDKFKVEETERNQEITRDVVQHYAVTRKNYNRMFDNLLRCLFQTIPIYIDREKLWQKVAFYNFVQRPMETIKQRPNKEDIQKGWRVFVEVLKVLNPTYCLFIGVTAADQFSKNIASLNIPYEPIKWERASDNLRRWARLFSIGEKGNQTQCVAIQHTSHHFSWRRWHEYLKRKPVLNCFNL